MKVSAQRLHLARIIRDKALAHVREHGMDGITATVRGTHRHATRTAELDGLKISHGRWSGEDHIDIWQGTKVFSVAWDISGALTVINFKPGDWQWNFAERPTGQHGEDVIELSLPPRSTMGDIRADKSKPGVVRFLAETDERPSGFFIVDEETADARYGAPIVRTENPLSPMA